METDNTIKPVILIVEDHDALRTSMCRWLSELFPCVECHEATSGEDAVIAAKKVHPLAILMDIGLPGINGIEAMKVIKQNDPSTHIVVLTILEGDHYQYIATNAGATAFVPKQTMYKKLPLVLEPILNCKNKPMQTVGAII